MKKIVRFTVCAAMSIFSCMASASTDISGNYKCTGFDANVKSNYTSSLVIQKTGDAYNLMWKSGDVSYTGTGIFSKTAPDTLATIFINPEEKIKSGVMIYQVKPNGSLDGSWVYVNNTVMSTETCDKSA